MLRPHLPLGRNLPFTHRVYLQLCGIHSSSANRQYDVFPRNTNALCSHLNNSQLGKHFLDPTDKYHQPKIYLKNLYLASVITWR